MICHSAITDQQLSKPGDPNPFEGLYPLHWHRLTIEFKCFLDQLEESVLEIKRQIRDSLQQAGWTLEMMEQEYSSPIAGGYVFGSITAFFSPVRCEIPDKPQNS